MKLATLCYIQKNNRVLMLHRVKKRGDFHRGKWNGLGGKFMPGETPEECVVREVREESGLSIMNPCLRGFLSFPLFDGKDDWYVFVYTATRFKGRLRRCREGNLAWIPKSEISSLNLWPGDRIFMPWLDQKKFFSARFVYRQRVFRSHKVSFY